MKVFVGGKLYDSRREVIGIVLNDQDKKNLAKMHPEATVYCEFVPKGGATEPGCREFSVESVQDLLNKIKERAAKPGADGVGAVAWRDIGQPPEAGEGAVIVSEPRSSDAPHVSDAELVARLRQRLAAVQQGPWQHWWCGDEYCDCHALEFPLRHELLTWDKKPARGREVLHMTRVGTGQLLFSGESETAPEIDLVCDAVNNLPLLLDRLQALADGGVTLTATKCRARHSNVGANDPQDCDWPFCDCDPQANRVIAAMQEAGLEVVRAGAVTPSRGDGENEAASGAYTAEGSLGGPVARKTEAMATRPAQATTPSLSETRPDGPT